MFACIYTYVNKIMERNILFIKCNLLCTILLYTYVLNFFYLPNLSNYLTGKHSTAEHKIIIISKV